jgi:hypothetical protein
VRPHPAHLHLERVFAKDSKHGDPVHLIRARGLSHVWLALLLVLRAITVLV